MPDNIITESVGAPLFRNRSNDIAKLAAALALAQEAFAPIPKDREVTVQTQTGGTYKFKYATLDAIRSATMPALSKQGLAIVQGMTADGKGLETTLYHSSGEWVCNVTPMLLAGKRGKDGQTYPPGNQELGSAQTYARRYGISALLCITADEDDDGNAADDNHTGGVPGSAGSGTEFRPARRGGVMAAASNSIKDAKRDIESGAQPVGKPAPPPKSAPTPENARSAKIKAATDKRVKALKDGPWTPDTLKQFWDGDVKWRTWMTDDANEALADWERYTTAYDDARDLAREAA